MTFKKDFQFYRFAAYGFLKNLRFFEPFLVLFFRDLGFSFFQIGVLFSIREISINLLEIPTGFFADMFGRKISMVASMLAYIISFLIFFFAPGFAYFAAAMILFAAGEAFRTGTHKAIILEHLRLKDILSSKVDYYGATRSWSQLGSALNALVAAGLVFCTGSYRIVFIAAIVPYVINLLNLVSYPKYLDHSTLKASKRETLKSFTMIFRRRDSLRGIFNSAVFDAFFKAVKEYLQPILKSLSLALPVFLFVDGQKRTALLVGIVYFLIYLGTSYASKNAGKLSRRFRSKEKMVNISYLAGSLMIVVSGISLILNIYYAVIVMFLLLFFLQNARRPVNIAYISEHIPHETMASGLSSESQIKTLLIAVLSPAIGFLADKFGIGPALIISGAVMGLLLIFYSLEENSQKSGVRSQ